MTVKEAAEYLKVHWQTVRNYIRSGKLKAVRAGRRIRIRESDVEAMLENGPAEKPKLEIEIRFLTPNRIKIEEKLLKTGAKVMYHGHVIDHYFAPETFKSIEDNNEAYGSGKGFGLRIREQDNGYTGRVTTTLENKKLAVPYHHDTCIETEIAVENYEETRRLLSTLNMKEFATLDKDRLVYKLGEIKVVIDVIKGFKTGIEIELVTDEMRETVLPRLKKLAGEIGLDVNKELVEKSVTYLYMQDYARF